MQFKGYCRRRQGRWWWAMGPGLVLALWLALAFVAMPAVVRDWLWALWFAAAGWGSLRTEGARWLRWGTGQLAGDIVTWEGDEPFTGRLVSRSDVGAIANGWGPRIVFPLLVGLWLWRGVSGRALFGQSMMQAVAALALLFAWQAWIRPVYSTVLTVKTEAGRRRIYVVQEETRRAVPS